ncbi:hypothetical protein ACLB1Q_13010 [Escherichia coli]
MINAAEKGPDLTFLAAPAGLKAGKPLPSPLAVKPTPQASPPMKGLEHNGSGGGSGNLARRHGERAGQCQQRERQQRFSDSCVQR